MKAIKRRRFTSIFETIKGNRLQGNAKQILGRDVELFSKGGGRVRKSRLSPKIQTLIQRASKIKGRPLTNKEQQLIQTKFGGRL